MTSDPRRPGSGDDPTGDETKLSPETPKESGAGWLSSSGSIDHGRFPPGTMLVGRYRVIGLLGKGGMGEVYRADDLRLGQQVALKFLPEGLGRDPINLAQFHNEVRTARQVSHPNVCRVYDIGEADGHLFLSMEYVDGEDLSSLLRRIGRLPEDKALEIARQICAGLAAAHERGVLHRDLKPANIMIDGAGRARIMDFSLASVGVVTDVLSGTPAYMAPEQLAGKSVSVKSDIYALGLVLYELFTGKRVFDAKSLADLMAQHASGSITTPTSVVKTLDATIERAILRCLDHDPARRPASALAVAASLPGGDPLAAALAAGETPSPEMVAAAGGENATIGPVAGVFWLTAAAALLVAVAALADRSSLLTRVPLTKPVAVLADRAEEIRKSLGYSDTPVDLASGLSYADDYLDWGQEHGRGETNWKELSEGRPAAVVFDYRTSLEPLLPYNRLGIAGSDDPPFVKAGMTMMRLDTKGRLTSFFALPPQEEHVSPPMPAPDWHVAFAAAGLDRSRALSGRIRDPLIGRDLLVGVVSGLLLQVIDSLHVWIPALLRWPDNVPARPITGVLEHVRYYVLTLNNAVNSGLQNALLSVLVFTLLREGVRRLLTRIKLQRFSTDYVAAAIAIVAVTFLQVGDTGLASGHIWLHIGYSALSSAVLLAVLLRFGLLATVVMSVVSALVNLMPLTLQSTSLYAGTSWLTLGLLFAMAALGLWFARAGEPLFGAPGSAGTGLASES